jgi:hypothetical protein
MTIFRRPCLHTEGNHAQMKPKVHFRACYTSMKIRGPTSRRKSAQDHEKRHFWQTRGRYKDPRAKWRTKPTKLQGNTKEQHQGPPISCPEEGGPEGGHLGSADLLGHPTPCLAQWGPSFSCIFSKCFLRRLLVVPPRKITQCSTHGGLYKEEESPKFNTQQ